MFGLNEKSWDLQPASVSQDDMPIGSELKGMIHGSGSGAPDWDIIEFGSSNGEMTGP